MKYETPELSAVGHSILSIQTSVNMKFFLYHVLEIGQVNEHFAAYSDWEDCS